MIAPKITHQTFATTAAPAPCNPLRQRMLDLHPNWTHLFYDDVACRELIRRELPHLLPVYDHYPSPIQRVDLFRIVAVYVHGGFYLDMDIQCHRALDPLCQHGCVLGEEKTLAPAHARALGHEHTLRIANYMFGSAAGHPFWLDVLEGMIEQAQRPIHCEPDILESTGPGLLTNVYHRVKDRYPDITLLRNDAGECQKCRGISCQFGQFASHHHVGSWRWEHTPAVLPSARLLTPAKADLTAHVARRLIGLNRTADTLPDQFIILKTYEDIEKDGLGTVFSRLHRLGRVTADTRTLTGRCVLVAGIPFLYTDKLSPDNANVVYTTFESTQLPRHWVDSINAHYHACIVPHERIKDVFVSSGVRVPVAVNHQGYTRHQRAVIPRDETFRVGFIGVPVRRKNLPKLLAACQRLRKTIPELRLCVHVSHYYDWMNQDDLNEIKAAPFVEWTEGVLDEPGLAEWFGRLSCYVYPSSAEGWSFTPREAMYLGIPTALTAIPVHEELVHSGFCTVIPTAGLENAAFEGGTFGQWHRVRVEDIQQAIGEIYRQGGPALDQARRGAQWIENKWQNAEMQCDLIDLLRRFRRW